MTSKSVWLYICLFVRHVRWQKINFVQSTKVTYKSCHICFSDDKNAFGLISLTLSEPCFFRRFHYPQKIGYNSARMAPKNRKLYTKWTLMSKAICRLSFFSKFLWKTQGSPKYWVLTSILYSICSYMSAFNFHFIANSRV